VPRGDAGRSPRIPEWITLREARFLTGLPEVDLRSLVEGGAVVGDRSLVHRLGQGFLLLRTSDLRRAGLLRGEEPEPDGPGRGEGSPTGPMFVNDVAGGQVER
jgi:hypothetical protein